MRLKKLFLIACAVLLVGGCSRMVPESYFEHLQAFDESVVTEYLEYVENDPKLIGIQKKNRLENVEMFRENLKEYTNDNDE